jgi:hypothetical protein
MPWCCKKFEAHLGDLVGDEPRVDYGYQDESCSGFDQSLARKGSRFSVVLGVGRIWLPFRSRTAQVKSDMASSVYLRAALDELPSPPSSPASLVLHPRGGARLVPHSSRPSSSCTKKVINRSHRSQGG